MILQLQHGEFEVFAGVVFVGEAQHHALTLRDDSSRRSTASRSNRRSPRLK